MRESVGIIDVAITGLVKTLVVVTIDVSATVSLSADAVPTEVVEADAEVVGVITEVVVAAELVGVITEVVVVAELVGTCAEVVVVSAEVVVVSAEVVGVITEIVESDGGG